MCQLIDFNNQNISCAIGHESDVFEIRLLTWRQAIHGGALVVNNAKTLYDILKTLVGTMSLLTLTLDP